MNEQKLEVTLVIMVHNEQGNLAQIVEDIRTVFDGWIYEMVFIDDGSVDETAAELRELKKRFTSLEIVTHAGRYGKSAALATGGRLARYPWLASL